MVAPLLLARSFSQRVHSWRFGCPIKSRLYHSSVSSLAAAVTGGDDKQIQGQVRGTIPKMGKGIAVGQVAEVDRMFTTQQVSAFGDLIQDKNILHSQMNWEEASKEMPHLQQILESGLIQLDDDDDDDNIKMTKPLVHGMMVSSLFSSIFATLSPGCVYMNQSLQFAAPVFVNELVTGRIEIEKVRKWRRGGVVVQCDTKVLRDDAVVIDGNANVWLPSGHAK